MISINAISEKNNPLSGIPESGLQRFTTGVYKHGTAYYSVDDSRPKAQADWLGGESGGLKGGYSLLAGPTGESSGEQPLPLEPFPVSSHSPLEQVRCQTEKAGNRLYYPPPEAIYLGIFSQEYYHDRAILGIRSILGIPEWNVVLLNTRNRAWRPGNDSL